MDKIGCVAVIALVIFCLLLPMFFGKWCCYNTELLASHYLEKEIDLPYFPFILGAYFTQVGLPYGIITEIWCQIIDIK